MNLEIHPLIIKTNTPAASQAFMSKEVFLTNYINRSESIAVL